MTAWIVRKARLDEVETLSLLEARAFGDAGWGKNAVAEGLTATAVSTLFATEENHSDPVAFALWRRLGDEAEILSIGVAPERRREGAAKALLAAIVAEAVERKIDRLFLEVEIGNDDAIALYADSGFEQIGRRARYYRNGCDALVMRLKL